nr:MAG TPA: hypothetical protein [Bacteriophage sp.]
MVSISPYMLYEYNFMIITILHQFILYTIN